MITSEIIGRPVYGVEEVIAMPAGGYLEHMQPTYRDQTALAQAAERLMTVGALTSPESVHALRGTLSEVATGQNRALVVVEGRCAEPIGNVAERVGDVIVRRQVVEYDNDGNSRGLIHVARKDNFTKPRSNATEAIDGIEVASYMGDAVNGKVLGLREPDPQRMLMAAEQALQVAEILEAQLPHVPVAHEALQLPFERSFLREIDGSRYLLSADLPWIGMRTNGSSGSHFDHIELLQNIENPVGIKIGASSDERHIRDVVQRLDGHLPGKLSFMLRVGAKDQGRLPEILDAIRTHAPESVLLYDIHGTTFTNEYDEKIRSVENIIAEINGLARTCSLRGLRLHGVHLETIGDSRRRECVDMPHHRPAHPGGVDPQLNPRQFGRVLDGIQGLR